VILKVKPLSDEVTFIVPVVTVQVGCVTVTVGAAGVAFGAAVPLPEALVHPLTVAFTVYEPAEVTVIEEVVAPLLHSNVPAAVVESTEFPQLFTTVTTGVEGVVFGAAMPLPGRLVQPLTLVVTV